MIMNFFLTFSAISTPMMVISAIMFNDDYSNGRDSFTLSVMFVLLVITSFLPIFTCSLCIYKNISERKWFKHNLNTNVYKRLDVKDTTEVINNNPIYQAILYVDFTHVPQQKLINCKKVSGDILTESFLYKTNLFGVISCMTYDLYRFGFTHTFKNQCNHSPKNISGVTYVPATIIDIHTGSQYKVILSKYLLKQFLSDEFTIYKGHIIKNNDTIKAI